MMNVRIVHLKIYKVDNVTYISDEFYVLEKGLEKLIKEN